MPQNPLNLVTQKRLTNDDIRWLDNATVFAIFRALSACYQRRVSIEHFTYNIRNGKIWVKDAKKYNKALIKENYKFLMGYLKSKINLQGKKIYIPKNIGYALPISEKSFVGNIPVGTSFYGNKLAVGVYWRNDWGAVDLDISGLNIGGKVGWDSAYNMEDELYYSGDITYAPNGAVEYLYANEGLSEPTLVINNVYEGNKDCKYKLIIGKGDKISVPYMMNPNNLFVDLTTKSAAKQTILGMFMPVSAEKQQFIVINKAFGNRNISSNNPITNKALAAFYEKWTHQLSLIKVLKELGATIVTTQKGRKNADVDLSLEVLEKDTIINLFMKK